MSVTEGHRPALHEAASHHWGRDVAVTLMERLPPSGWGDVATRQQLDAVESRIDAKLESLELRMNARFAAIDARFDAADERMDLKLATLESRIETRLAIGHRQLPDPAGEVTLRVTSDTM